MGLLTANVESKSSLLSTFRKQCGSSLFLSHIAVLPAVAMPTTRRIYLPQCLSSANNLLFFNPEYCWTSEVGKEMQRWENRSESYVSSVISIAHFCLGAN